MLIAVAVAAFVVVVVVAVAAATAFPLAKNKIASATCLKCMICNIVVCVCASVCVLLLLICITGWQLIKRPTPRFPSAPASANAPNPVCRRRPLASFQLESCCSLLGGWLPPAVAAVIALFNRFHAVRIGAQSAKLQQQQQNNLWLIQFVACCLSFHSLDQQRFLLGLFVSFSFSSHCQRFSFPHKSLLQPASFLFAISVVLLPHLSFVFRRLFRLKVLSFVIEFADLKYCNCLCFPPINLVLIFCTGIAVCLFVYYNVFFSKIRITGISEMCENGRTQGMLRRGRIKKVSIKIKLNFTSL